MFDSLKLETNAVASERVTNCDSGTVHLERRMRPDIVYIICQGGNSVSAEKHLAKLYHPNLEAQQLEAQS